MPLLYFIPSVLIHLTDALPEALRQAAMFQQLPSLLVGCFSPNLANKQGFGELHTHPVEKQFLTVQDK